MLRLRDRLKRAAHVPGQQMSWLDRNGEVQRLLIIAVVNDDPDHDPGPLAA
jgi:hypothetical protein